MPWQIECEVWGGVTGHRISCMKKEGKIAEFATYEEAKAECDVQMARTQGNPYRVANFSYTPVEVWVGNL